MPGFLDINTTAQAAAQEFLARPEAFPGRVQTKLSQGISQNLSPVETIVCFAEAVYANLHTASPEAREVAAGCAELAAQNGYHQLDQDGRGQKMGQVLRGLNCPEPIPIPQIEMQAPPVSEMPPPIIPEVNG